MQVKKGLYNIYYEVNYSLNHSWNKEFDNLLAVRIEKCQEEYKKKVSKKDKNLTVQLVHLNLKRNTSVPEKDDTLN